MIALERVSKSFDGGASFAVRQVTLEVPERSFLAVAGESGSGKTTLLKLMNRLLDPDEGSIAIAGQPARSLPPYALRRRIGYVFQGVGLFPHMSIAENIGITPRLIGWPESEIRARVDELLDLVALPRPYSRRKPGELSGGQQQRVGIARALAARPAIMLMDEPFGALDPVTRDALGTEYRRLHDDMGLTTVLVTHDVMEAVLLADRIVIMRGGGVVANGLPHELLAGHPDPAVRALMDMPRRRAERVSALTEERAARG